jgi:tetratricopeptide (TPR) repeat protein
MNTLRNNPEFRVPGLFLGLLAVLLLSACSPRSFQIKKAEALYNKGQILETEGHQDEAISKFNESMVLAGKAEFRPGVANNLNEIAIIATNRGEYEKARALFTRALRIYREMDWKPEVSKSLNNIALTYLKELNFDAALKGYRELLEWDERAGNRLGEMITLNNTGFIYDHYLGDPKEARRSYRKALKIARELGNRKYIEILEEKLQIK